MTQHHPSIQQQLNHEVQAFVQANIARQEKFSRTGAPITYDNFLEDKILLIFAIREGIPYTMFDLIAAITPFSMENWAEILNISTKTLQRIKTSQERFKPLQSEKIIEIAEVTKLGNEVFGDPDKFGLWLETPNFALGNLKPIDLLRNSYGKEMVMGELTRMEYGIFA